MIETIDLEEGDAEFLSIVDSIEAEAIRSASRAKRQKIEANIKEEEEEEGDYLAALKGRHSSAWKKNEKQHENSYGYNHSVNNKKQNDETVSRNTNGGEDVAVKMCVCGIGYCLVLTSNTVKNPGRKFYRCPVKQENGGCSFFEWCDSPSSGLPACGRTPTEGRSNYGFSNLSSEPGSMLRQTSGNNYPAIQSSTERKGSSSCFKCWQGGHWARDCVNSSSSDSFSALSGYKQNPSGLSGSCFKCGKSGHWARDCTEQHYSANVGVEKKSRPAFQTPFTKKYN